jgi:hypothetical protein
MVELTGSRVHIKTWGPVIYSIVNVTSATQFDSWRYLLKGMPRAFETQSSIAPTPKARSHSVESSAARVIHRWNQSLAYPIDVGRRVEIEISGFFQEWEEVAIAILMIADNFGSCFETRCGFIILPFSIFAEYTSNDLSFAFT